MFVNVKINEHPIKALVDTGSEITMISDKLANELGLTVTKYKGRQITGVNSQPVEITGETQVEVVVSDEFNERSISITAVTIKNFHLNFLLGYDFHFISKSLIDIYNNNIIFNSLAKENDSKILNNKELNKNALNKMHSIENIEVPANGMNIVKCAPSYKKPILDVDCVTRSNPSMLSRRKIYVKDQNIKVKKGIANIPVVNLSDKPVAISAGSIVSDYELPVICASATAKDFDVMANPRTAKIVQEDMTAYCTFCKILDSAKGIPETVLFVASRLCNYCALVDYHSDKECNMKVIYHNGTDIYRDEIIERRKRIMILSAEFTLWYYSQRDNLTDFNKRKRQPKVSKNTNVFLFGPEEIKLSADCIFQELYVRAVDKTFDPLNVIYYYSRLCDICNRYKCCDPDFKCVHIPAYIKSETYKHFKQAERNELENLIKEYLERHKITADVAEKYRRNKRVIPNILNDSNHPTSSASGNKPHPVFENESLLTPKVEYDSISEDGSFIQNFLDNLPDDLPVLEDFDEVKDIEDIQCNALYSEDLVRETESESEMFTLNEYDVKCSAEGLFQEIYNRAVDRTKDPLNVIYYGHRVCEFCNRFKCCKPGSGCVFEPVFKSSPGFQKFKQAERKELDILMTKYLEYYKIPTEIIKKYQTILQPSADLQESELKKMSYLYPEMKDHNFRNPGLYKDISDKHDQDEEKLNLKQPENLEELTDPKKK
jgi:hypothetical protein